MPTAATTVMLFSSADTLTPQDGAAALALQLCVTADARLTAVLLDLQESNPNPRRNPQFGGAEGDELIALQGRALTEAAAAVGVDAEIVTSLSHSFGVGGCLADRLRLHDIGVIGASRDGVMSERILAQHLIFDSGRPVLVAPAQLARPFALSRAVVAWDNTRAAARALNDAIALCGTGAELVLLTIGDDKDIAGSMEPAEIVHALQRRGLQVRSETRNREGANIGEALQRAAIDLGGDFLAMGGFAHSRLRELLLGGATGQVLDNPQLPVLLSH